MSTGMCDAERIAEAVHAVPGIARLSGGSFGMGTYLPGRRVTGVLIGEGTVEVHVIGTYGSTVADIATGVRDAVRPVAGDRRVDVIIEDLS